MTRESTLPRAFRGSRSSLYSPVQEQQHNSFLDFEGSFRSAFSAFLESRRGKKTPASFPNPAGAASRTSFELSAFVQYDAEAELGKSFFRWRLSCSETSETPWQDEVGNDGSAAWQSCGVPPIRGSTSTSALLFKHLCRSTTLPLYY